ncbi:T9SS type A sorting domain-containing protein, partial [bacterium]|nr:T9SS type A sorting domain-containing protein [bacterium]
GKARSAHIYQSTLVLADNMDLSVFGIPLGLISSGSGIPLDYTLQDPYPNPFNPTAAITFALRQSQSVDLLIYDLMGRQVASLWSGNLIAGEHRFDWHPTANVASGQYFITLKVGDNHTVKPIVFLK